MPPIDKLDPSAEAATRQRGYERWKELSLVLFLRYAVPRLDGLEAQGVRIGDREYSSLAMTTDEDYGLPSTRHTLEELGATSTMGIILRIEEGRAYALEEDGTISMDAWLYLIATGPDGSDFHEIDLSRKSVSYPPTQSLPDDVAALLRDCPDVMLALPDEVFKT